MNLIVGIVTVSDRASRGEYEDLGGPAIESYLKSRIASPFEIRKVLIPDECDEIARYIAELCDEGCDFVVTTGGTGPAVRDVTPEATEAVCEKLLPGFGEAMRAVSLRDVPTAILSRQTAGIRGRSLIVNLPGKPAAIEVCLDAVLPAVPKCLSIMDAAPMELIPVDGS